MGLYVLYGRNFTRPSFPVVSREGRLKQKTCVALLCSTSEQPSSVLRALGTMVFTSYASHTLHRERKGLVTLHHRVVATTETRCDQSDLRSS